jgi:NAD-dependent SIR2 family protein deacetylase
VHGNTILEKCAKCGKEYLRDFKVRNAKKVHDHFTGRKCDDPGCRGKLKDSIINFGEQLPEKELDAGFENAETADVCLVLGSSLRVTPAADMPKRVAQRHHNLVIVNLQATPLDAMCALRIYALCDNVMQLLMSKL